MYVRSLQCYGDAVQKNEKEDNMIKHLVTNDPLTPQPQPEEKHRKKETASEAELQSFT